ncbi:MAG TPA: F0F1 ATP synthase subunit epsilon [Burkholderiales bacterium]|nr:F0F1 ATP synthase subunit epsilon [Burkholderiales bacterium]
MSTFTLHLQSAAQYERVDAVTSFVGEDATGQFGILASHERFITSLRPALARFATSNGVWQYLALPGGVLYFNRGELFVSTGRYAKGDDYRRMRATLHERILTEEKGLDELRSSVRRLENEMFRRLYELQRHGASR